MSNEELIEKIRELKPKGFYNTEKYNINIIFNDGIAQVIDLLKQCNEPKILDKPDRAGWWFELYPDGKICDCVHVVENDVGCLEIEYKGNYISINKLRYFKFLNANAPENHQELK